MHNCAFIVSPKETYTGHFYCSANFISNKNSAFSKSEKALF